MELWGGGWVKSEVLGVNSDVKFVSKYCMVEFILSLRVPFHTYFFNEGSVYLDWKKKVFQNAFWESNMQTVHVDMHFSLEGKRYNSKSSIKMYHIRPLKCNTWLALSNSTFKINCPIFGRTVQMLSCFR